jgi:hypothetical protein
MAVLRIGIRCFFTPGSGMGKISGSGMNIWIRRDLKQLFFIKHNEMF